jgi:hypothetical protein
MKKYLLLTLLAACTSTLAENPTHKAISALLLKNMNDPTSYQPVRWGKPEAWTVSDSISAHAFLLKNLLHTNNLATIADSTSLQQYSKLPYAQKYLVGQRVSLPKHRHQRDSLRSALAHLPAATDTTRLGYYITHAFRAKNKLGALVLDSVEFYVDKAGRVKMHG